jgi:hypothetical protein
MDPTTLTFSDFYDSGFEIESSGCYEQYVDLGDAGECYISVDPDDLIGNENIEGSLGYVSITVSDIASKATDEDEVKPLLAALIELVGLDVIFGYLAEVEEEEN